MKALNFVTALFAVVIGFASQSFAALKPELIIYTYDSFVAKNGLGAEIVPIFERRCGCKVKLIPCGDGGQILTRLGLDANRGKPTAHVALGVDQYLWLRMKRFIEPWGDWRPKGYSSISKDVQVAPGFLPFDYGVLAFMLDQKQSSDAPLELKALLEARWNRKFILENPKTSTPGLAFLLHTVTVLGEKVWEFWSNLRGRWLAMLPGWDAAYGLFLNQEAPLVWSYTTSQAYHREHGDSGDKPRYRALMFKEGQPLQVEGALLIHGALNETTRNLARSFLEFLITPEVQNLIPRKNWMLPVLAQQSVNLPASFRNLPNPVKISAQKLSIDELDPVLKRFSQVVEGGGR